jgi:hypothetical protein
MQKACVAIVLALALTCVVADYTPITAGWVKVPVGICNDTENTCTNFSSIALGSLTATDVSLIANNIPTVDKNSSSVSWSIFTKTIATKDLSSSANATYTYTAALQSSVSFGYALGLISEKDSTTNITNWWLYQTKINGATSYPRVQITNNTNANFTPTAAGLALSTKSVFIFYVIADKKINATSVTLGTSTLGKEFTLTSGYTGGRVQAATGEALSANQVYATWSESDTALKVAVVDFSAATVTGTADLGGFNKAYACGPYATDKKYYGVVCTNTSNQTTTVFVSANSTTLLQLFTTNATTQIVGGNIAYAGYLAFFYTNPTPANATTLSYDIWNVESFTSFKNKTDYLTTDPSTSAQTQYRIPQGGLYVLSYNIRANTTVGATKVQVGLLLGASYLTSVFGFLVTIIAGLFLF